LSLDGEVVKCAWCGMWMPRPEKPAVTPVCEECWKKDMEYCAGIDACYAEESKRDERRVHDILLKMGVIDEPHPRSGKG